MSTLAVCPKCDSINRVDAQKARQGQATCGKCGASLQMHGLASPVTASGLKRILKNTRQPVIVDFWASWCGPCKMYAPIFERASVENPDAVFLKVDTERDPGLSQELGIRGIPTTILFKNGQEVRREAGVLPENALAQILR